MISQLKELAANAVQLLAPVFSAEAEPRIRPFKLKFGRPVLSHNAAFLPISNPTGEITLIRKKCIQLIESSPHLYQSLEKHGLKIPEGIHTTILRFQANPNNLDSFLAEFDSISLDTNIGSATIDEILVTSETKPYHAGRRHNPHVSAVATRAQVVAQLMGKRDGRRSRNSITLVFWPGL